MKISKPSRAIGICSSEGSLIIVSLVIWDVIFGKSTIVKKACGISSTVVAQKIRNRGRIGKKSQISS